MSIEQAPKPIKNMAGDREKPSQENLNSEQRKPEENNNEDVINKIRLVRQEVATLGFNDSEIPELNQLIEKVHSGELDPERALERAHKIKNSKQDYH